MLLKLLDISEYKINRYQLLKIERIKQMRNNKMGKIQIGHKHEVKGHDLDVI